MTRRRAIILLVFLCSVSLGVAVVISVRRPAGEWDAWAIWNAKARVLIEGDDIRSTVHPDYPLLLPIVIALLWWLIGSQTSVVPAAVSVAFGAATVAMLIRAVRRNHCETTAIISGCVLLSSPFFITQSAAQYADIPLSLLILTSLARVDSPVLAGALAGLASCVKNEGLLFVVALTIALTLRRRSALIRFFVGAALPLIALLYFKAFLSTPNDLLGSLSTTTLFERIGDPWRYGQILGTLAVELINVFLWGAGTLPLLFIYCLCVKPRPSEQVKPLIQVISVTLVVMLFGFITVYLITPMDLRWHLGTSADRLILQLFPTTLFLFFLIVGTPAAKPNGTPAIDGSQSPTAVSPNPTPKSVDTLI
jgi:hypothetical protein